MYLIELDQGDYYQSRGGYGWRRSEAWEATLFGSIAEAEAEIRRCDLQTFGARVVEASDL
jgi:hypothetical protein